MKTTRILAAICFALTATAARADYVVKDGNAATQTIKAGTISGNILPWYMMVDSTGAAFGTTSNPQFINFATGALLPAFAATPTFNCGTGCSSTGGTFNNNADGVATSSTNGQNASWLYGWNGTTWDRLKEDTTNGLWVNVKAGTSTVNPTTAANWGIGATGAAVPANALFWGVNIAGNMVGPTGLALGATTKAPTVAIVDGSGNQITAFGGSGGTASNYGSTFPTAGTAIGLTNGTNMVAWSATTNYGTAPAAIAVPAVNAAITNSVTVTGTFWPYTLGQQLAAASVPVILPAATITTLTPPAAITGYATSATQGGATDVPCTLPASATSCSEQATLKAIANAANSPVAAGTNTIGNVGSDPSQGKGTPQSAPISLVVLATPVNSAFSTSTSGGTLAATTAYYYRVTATNAAGETLASTETSITTGAGATNSNTVNWGAVTGATGYNVYGRTTGGELKIATLGNVLTYLDTGSVTPSGALPAANTTAASTQVVAASGSTSIYVTSFDFIMAGTSNVSVVYGTGTNCGTGQVALTGLYPAVAQTGISKGAGVATVLKVPASQALCVLSSAGNIAGGGSASFQQF